MTKCYFYMIAYLYSVTKLNKSPLLNLSSGLLSTKFMTILLKISEYFFSYTHLRLSVLKTFKSKLFAL